jgi:hypothetical protein
MDPKLFLLKPGSYKSAEFPDQLLGSVVENYADPTADYFST